MLMSLKLNAPGPYEFKADMCACGCEVYMSPRPHVGIPKEGGCIAANGEEASIIRCIGMRIN